MARKETVVTLDDLSGASGAKLKKFGLDGVSYEIDLTDDNARQLDEALAEYVSAARKAIDTPATRSAARKADAAELAANREKNRQIKQWARENGYSVSDRGRIPVNVLAAWKDANEGSSSSTSSTSSSSSSSAAQNGSTDGSTNQPPQHEQHEQHDHQQHEHHGGEVRVDVPAFSAAV
jgi:hypothetical protein